jgi:hypothetical protein
MLISKGSFNQDTLRAKSLLSQALGEESVMKPHGCLRRIRRNFRGDL